MDRLWNDAIWRHAGCQVNPFSTIVNSFLALFSPFLTLYLSLYTHELLDKRQEAGRTDERTDGQTDGRTFWLFNIIIIEIEIDIVLQLE